ncbi:MULTISPECIES: uracil-DNA glycosylase [Hyphomicrobium]|uniref:uracil-DNA glycosylase n=1 Tax=Hyphomicrobium TaxID=81 RepID=UPI00047B4D49|nr:MULTISPECIES: uracil-DNA glycosylase [Hyphomicrobium]WBT37459.1 uracil-DNA glycosylase [Hyphomicrobium sp. DMF-1]HML42283.1 uracil-DNA glycosylase [Hyphomicrobium zavarzinii]
MARPSSPTLPDYTPEAPRDCPRCPRLVAFRNEAAQAQPSWFNGAVPSFGNADARLLVVGLAPGLRGANRTGRPFTGDYAGDLLYSTLLAFGFARGTYRADPNDGLRLVDCMITNAVRCVPPGNKPLPEEIHTCRGYFSARLAALPKLKALVVLGRVAHDQTLSTLGLRKSQFAFRHGARHQAGTLTIFDSLHCSRLNTNTGRLTTEMFHAVFRDVRHFLDELP